MIAMAEGAFGNIFPSRKYLYIKVVTVIPATAGWKVFWSSVLPGLHSLPALLPWGKAWPRLSHVGVSAIPEHPHSFGGSAQGWLGASVKPQVWA